MGRDGFMSQTHRRRTLSWPLVPLWLLRLSTSSSISGWRRERAGSAIGHSLPSCTNSETCLDSCWRAFIAPSPLRRRQLGDKTPPKSPAEAGGRLRLPATPRPSSRPTTQRGEKSQSRWRHEHYAIYRCSTFYSLVVTELFIRSLSTFAIAGRC